MSANTKQIDAALLFTDETLFNAARLAGPARQALDLFGANGNVKVEPGYDRIRFVSPIASIEARIDEVDHADPDAPKLLGHITPSLRLLISLRQHQALPFADQGALVALLAEVLHGWIEITGAPFLQWLDTDTILPSARFQAVVTPIRWKSAEVEGPEAAAEMPADNATDKPPPNVANTASRPTIAMPRRVKATGVERNRRCGTAIDMVQFKAQIKAARQARAWAGLSDAPLLPELARIGSESLEDVFRVEVELPKGMIANLDREVSMERRVATWTMNASVAVFAPPVGAAMLTYNVLRGENFRLTAQALTLTGAFMGLGLTKAVAATIATVAVLPL
ncbi:hypothetical protein [Pseudooceanicola sp.]|uniref:hypothetical protein n=1 Tax=Pseudooceanicola sp. TaxID=1914328 RepID=UPI002628BD85|nr:hypothetical protein [Pseudooceanicola sp.]MDF1854760.1 hypothetical protein [Pseudooceanicola sp.]